MRYLRNRVRQATAIDLEILAIFRLLLALIVAWGLVGRWQVRDYLFPAAENVQWTLMMDRASDLGAGPGSLESLEPIEDPSVGPLYSSRDSRGVWTIWHWSWLWLDQVVEGVHETLMHVQPVERPATDLEAPPSEPGEPDPWLKTYRFLASRVWFDCVVIVGLISAALMAVGLFTKMSNFLLWTVVLSIHLRMPLFNSGGDSLERLFLFWLLFLPAGAVWSLDARCFPRQGFWRKRLSQWRMQQQQSGTDPTAAAGAVRPWISNWASTALLAQLVAIYFFSGLEKWNQSWWSGTAVAEALSWGFITKHLAASLTSFPWLLSGLTWAVLSIELLLPLLVFCPGLFRWTRRPAIWLLVGMHLGIAATLSIGTFSAVCLAGWVLFARWPVAGGWSWRSLWQDNRDSGQELPGRIANSTRAVSTAGEWVVIGLFSLMLWWNLSQVPRLASWLPYPIQLRPVLSQLALDAHFPMFARLPEHDYYWEHRVELPSGDSLDIRPQLPPPLGLPNRIEGWYESHDLYLWRQLHVNLLYLEEQQPDFVALVRERLQAMEFAEWKRRMRRGDVPKLVADDQWDEVFAELVMVDRETGDEQAWSFPIF